MLALLMMLLAQDGLGVRTVKAAEVIQSKPGFEYPYPEWADQEYLFSISGLSLTSEVEACIDATILTMELGGKPVNPAMISPAVSIQDLKPQEALKVLELRLEENPPAQVRRQIYLYRIKAGWMNRDLDLARRNLDALASDEEASIGVDLGFLSDLLSYWETDGSAPGDSLLYYLLYERHEEKALGFLSVHPSQGVRYHLDEKNTGKPEGVMGRYLYALRMVDQRDFSQAEDSLEALASVSSPFQPLSRYHLAKTQLELDNPREAHLAVPDSFSYQWLLPEASLAFIKGRVEWNLGRKKSASKWFKTADEEKAFDLYIHWLQTQESQDPSTRDYFKRNQAAPLYDALRAGAFFRQETPQLAVPVLEQTLGELDVSRPSPLSDYIIALYACARNYKEDYPLTLRLADAVKERGSDIPTGSAQESYFVTLAHLAVGDAYYYSAERYQDLAREFYSYCSQSSFSELRQLGYFGLAWSYLGERDMESIQPIVAALGEEELSDEKEDAFRFLRGFTLYARRDFKKAAEVFAQLNFSSVPEMRMQGLYFEARSYELSNRPGLAASAYQDVVSDFPAEPPVRDAWSRLVRAQLEMGDLDDAEKTLNRLIEQARFYHFSFMDLYTEILLMLFDAAMQQGDQEQARQMAQRFSRAQNSTLALEAYYYRVAEKDTALWQVDHLIGLIDEMTEINPQSVYIPPLLLKAARMEIELADYQAAREHLQQILQWPRLQDVSDMLPEASYEMIRAAVLAEDWDRIILRTGIFLNSYPETKELTPRVLYFRAAALINRAENAEPFARKQSANQALDALDRLESSFGATDFFKESAEDIKSLRSTARSLTR